MHRVDGGLRLAGAAGRELPERDVVVRGRRRLELVRTASLRSSLPRNVLVARPEPVARPRPRRIARLACVSSATTTAASRVVEVVGVVLRLEERVRLGGDRADLLRAVPERDELDGVAERRAGRAPPARTPSSRSTLPQRLTSARQLGVRRRARSAPISAVRSPRPSSTLRSTNQVARLSSCGRSACVITPRPRGSARRASPSASRTSARPSSAVASAGAPQYAWSMPIATKSVCPAPIAAGMSTCRSSRAQHPVDVDELGPVGEDERGLVAAGVARP